MTETNPVQLSKEVNQLITSEQDPLGAIRQRDETIERLVTELEKCSKELWTRKETIERLTRERNEERREKEALQTGCEVWAGIVGGFRIETEAIKAELEKAREEKETAVDDWQKQVNEMRGTLNEAREEIARLKADKAEAYASEIHSLRAELTAAREDAKKWNDCAQTIGGERDAAVARAEKAETLATYKDQTATTFMNQVKKLHAERDTLRQQLAEAEKKLTNILTDVNYEGGIPWHNARYNDLCIASSRIAQDHAESLASLEATREALEKCNPTHVWDMARQYYTGNHRDSITVYHDELCALCAMATAALSLSPSTALHALKLEIAKRAWKEAWESSHQHTYFPNKGEWEANRDRAWLASDIRAELTKENPNS